MGYYTQYEITAQEGTITQPMKDRFEAISSYDFDLDEGCKWYGCNEDMIQLSTEYPDVIWKLTGDGEESGDMWEAYFKAGKHYVVQPVFPPFDRSRLGITGPMKTYKV